MTALSAMDVRRTLGAGANRSRHPDQRAVDLDLSRKLPHPDPAGRRLSEMHRATPGSQSHRLVVLALLDLDLCFRAQFEVFQKFQELPIFLVHAKNLCLFTRAKIR